jgi:cellulose synthase operon protein B
LLAATRGLSSASVGQVSPIELSTERVTFDQLGVPPDEVEVFGRADLGAIIGTRRLPAGTRPARLLLDVMVAPDGAGAKAVVSAFINERLVGSTVAAIGGPTHLDLPLPDGLVGTIANLRVVVERDIAQGDCRFGPQGYPAQILGSSALVLGPAGGSHDFSDLTSRFVRGVDVLVPANAADQPARVLGLLAQVTNQLSPDTAPLNVAYVSTGSAPVPEGPFIAVSDVPPAGASPHVRFDRGRVAVIDQSGHTLLDLGGFNGGAVAQVLQVGDTPGLWIKPLAADGQAPSPPQLRLDHGDVAFVDDKGVALAMSTERDTLVRISYPDQVSWLTVADRFRSWIIAGLWLLATAALLLTLQRLFRRRPAGSASE